MFLEDKSNVSLVKDETTVECFWKPNRTCFCKRSNFSRMILEDISNVFWKNIKLQSNVFGRHIEHDLKKMKLIRNLFLQFNSYMTFIMYMS